LNDVICHPDGASKRWEKMVDTMRAELDVVRNEAAESDRRASLVEGEKKVVGEGSHVEPNGVTRSLQLHPKQSQNAQIIRPFLALPHAGLRSSSMGVHVEPQSRGLSDTNKDRFNRSGLFHRRSVSLQPQRAAGSYVAPAHDDKLSGSFQDSSTAVIGQPKSDSRFSGSCVAKAPTPVSNPNSPLQAPVRPQLSPPPAQQRLGDSVTRQTVKQASGTSSSQSPGPPRGGARPWRPSQLGASPANGQRNSLKGHSGKNAVCQPRAQYTPGSIQLQSPQQGDRARSPVGLEVGSSQSTHNRSLTPAKHAVNARAQSPQLTFPCNLVQTRGAGQQPVRTKAVSPPPLHLASGSHQMRFS